MRGGLGEEGGRRGREDGLMVSWSVDGCAFHLLLLPFTSISSPPAPPPPLLLPLKEEKK